MTENNIDLSVVVPVYNEASGIVEFNRSLEHVLSKAGVKYEVIYVDDGSKDDSRAKIASLAKKNQKVRLVSLTRNFGKEAATTAGLRVSRGKGTLLIDADGQHPVGLIPDFVSKWQAGAKVVVGVRRENKGEGWVKKHGSRWFYRIFNSVGNRHIVPGSTDYRLIDREVNDAFNSLTERDRITRGLIDWLGYPRDYIWFDALPRENGKSGYTFGKLFKLAVDSVVSFSAAPLYAAALVGLAIACFATLVGVSMVVNYFLNDPLSLNARASAYGMVLVLFLIGVILTFQGIIGIYLSHIHNEVKNRPLYLARRDEDDQSD